MVNKQYQYIDVYTHRFISAFSLQNIKKRDLGNNKLKRTNKMITKLVFKHCEYGKLIPLRESYINFSFYEK